MKFEIIVRISVSEMFLQRLYCVFRMVIVLLSLFI
ncbi:MAG: hypothetical protein ACI9SD_001168 [Pseudohongiellaceae bacterium]|jgi:hypothetical protein